MPSLFTLKSILRQKKHYGNSYISPCKNVIFKKSLKRNQNPSRYYFLEQIKYFFLAAFLLKKNSLTYLKFQHNPKYHLSKILIQKQRPKSLKLLYSIMNLNTISLPWQARPTNEPLFACWILWTLPKPVVKGTGQFPLG